jgi:hypothetical protein
LTERGKILVGGGDRFLRRVIKRKDFRRGNKIIQISGEGTKRVQI